MIRGWIQDIIFKEELSDFDDGFNRNCENKRGVQKCL